MTRCIFLYIYYILCLFYIYIYYILCIFGSIMEIENAHFEFKYSLFHKTLPKSILQMYWISVRFYETGCRRIIEHCNFIQNFTSVVKKSKMQSDHSPFGCGCFISKMVWRSVRQSFHRNFKSFSELSPGSELVVYHEVLRGGLVKV